MTYFDPGCAECVAELEDGTGPYPMADHTGHRTRSSRQLIGQDDHLRHGDITESGIQTR